MATEPTTPPRPVSKGNPCPFLRALVALGLVPDEGASGGVLTATIVRVAKAGDGTPAVPSLATRLVATVANGLGPISLVRNLFGTVRIDQLRGGPLDKQGVGSGILDASAQVREDALARLDTFASDKPLAGGGTERGLDAAEITRFMDANFARAEGRRRVLDRRLMEGEWPILLQVLGKDGPKGRHLAVADVRTLVTERRFPARMLERLGKNR